MLVAALHWDSALHHPAVPAAHHGAILPGLHSGETPLAQFVCKDVKLLTTAGGILLHPGLVC